MQAGFLLGSVGENYCKFAAMAQHTKSSRFMSGRNFIAGRKPVLDALAQGSGVDKVLVYRNAGAEFLQQLKKAVQHAGVPLQMVPAEKLNALTNVQHQGVIAFKAAITYYDLQTIIDQVVENGEAPLFFMLDGITDVRNIGAIARSAVCCGVQALIIPDKGVAALGEDAVKSSAGALMQVHVCRVNSLMKAVDLLHMNGISVWASDMQAKENLFALDLTQPVAIVMGGEEKGVFTGIQKIADGQFKIPMQGNFESLNVSVAAGMMMYEAMKQRMGNA